MRRRLFRIAASGLLVTLLGWVLFLVMITVLDDGGPDEHLPRTFLEIVFNTLWAILQWPYLIWRFFPDYYGDLLLVPLTAVSIAFWGFICDWVWRRFNDDKRGPSGIEKDFGVAYYRLIALLNLKSGSPGKKPWASRLARTVMFLIFCIVPIHFLVPDEGSAILMQSALLLMCVAGGLSLLARHYAATAWAFIGVLLNAACYH